jgi:ribonucleoside-diphosphate reductase alpha chain
MYVTDRFMENYINGTTYRADYMVRDTGEIIKHTVNPIEIMDAIIDRPEKAFDPALVFENRFKDYHFFGGSDKTDKMSQNGCNEMVGVDGATCLLATMNWSAYVVNPFTEDAYFNYESFSNDVREVIMEMDTILDEGVDRNPLEKQKHIAKEWRNLGLGITALADCLIALGLRYGSDEAIEFTNNTTSCMRECCIEASLHMGKTRGQSQTILEMESEMESKGISYIKGLRNCALMAHAPSGTGSTMHSLSTGIEPVFRSEYIRSVTKDGIRGEYENFIVKHPQIQKCIEMGGNIEACVDSRDVTPLEKVKMLEAIQKHTDMCSSNTTNLKKGVTCEEIKEMYVEAWKRGVTSMSIYVDGSLDGVLNDVGKTDDSVVLDRGIMSLVPNDTYYIPRKITHGCGEMKVMIGYSQSIGKVTDCYVIPKMGSGCTKNITGEAILISQVLRLGGDLRDIKESVKGIEGCNSCVSSRMRGRAVDGINCPNILIDAVIEVQNEMGNNKIATPIAKEIKVKSKKKITTKTTCPECGGGMASIGGCQQCYDCGYSHCS